MSEKLYTREEVDAMVNPLLDQITFYTSQNIKLKKFIRKINMFSFLRKKSFLDEILTEENESGTIIFDEEVRTKYFRLSFNFLKHVKIYDGKEANI